MPISSFILQIMKHHCLHPLQYELVCTLNLVIRLRVCNQRCLMLNAEIYTTPCKLCCIELCTIVYEDPSGNVESEDYAMQKLGCCLLCDVHS
jgi:hypothetical protein